MNEEELQKVLDELYAVRPEMLNDKAKRLFDAIMKIADERDKYKDLYERCEKFLIKIKKLDPFLQGSSTDTDTMYEHIETVVREFNRLEDLEDTTDEMQACIAGLKEKIKEHEHLEEEMTVVIKSTRRENDRKLRAIWLMAREIKQLREYDKTCLVEDIVKGYLEYAKISGDDDHIPRVD